jgi:protein ImuA
MSTPITPSRYRGASRAHPAPRRRVRSPAGGGNGAIHGAGAALFAAGIAARTRGKVLWGLTRPDLFAPALAQAGLMPGRVIYVEAGDERSVLICFEEGLRHGGLGVPR